MDPHEELVRELRKEMKAATDSNGHLQEALRRCLECRDCPAEISTMIQDFQSTGGSSGGAANTGAFPYNP